MRASKAPFALVSLVVVSFAASAAAVEHGSFGIGLNTSLSAGIATGANPGIGGGGALSFRYWASQNFAIDPNFGFAVQSVQNGATTFGFLVGARFLFSVANTQSLRFNVGGEFMFDIASVSGTGVAANNTSTVPGLLLGP